MRFLLRVPPRLQGTVAFRATRRSHRRAVHQHATLPLCPVLATIALSLAFVGIAAKALIPDLVYDDLAYLASADPGNATPDNGDDDGKPPPGDGATASKFGSFEKAILVTIDLAVPQSLMLIHGLVVPDEAREITLPDRYLPNGETGPPVSGRHRAQAISAGPRPLFSRPQPVFPIVRTNRANLR